jgi:glycosyltransferase involved in cell wall biosynthesis
VRLALIAPLVAPIREPNCGGAQAFLADLATGLARRGHHVDVFAASQSEIDGAHVVDVGVDASTLRAFLYRAGGHPQIDAAPFTAAYARVFAALRKRSYDVVHNHAFDAPAIRSAVDITTPVIHTLHLPPEGSVIDAVRFAARAQRPPLVATVSPAQADAWGQCVDIDMVLRPGIATERIAWSVAAGTGVIFAGRLSPEKGALDAIAIARQAGMSIDLYGDGYDDAYAQRVVDAARGQADVRVHAAVPRATLWQAFANAAAVLCPVHWDEPFGLVAAEAQACGTPVIAYRRGGLQNTIIDGVTGFLVEPGDGDAAAAALGDIDQLDRARCRSHAQTSLDLEAVLDMHESTYEHLRTATLAKSHA